MTPLRTAVVGTGQAGQAHGRALQQATGLRLVAAADPDADSREAFSRSFGALPTYPDLAALLRTERPEVVHLCSPPGLHADQAIACLEAGAWVMCEKPLCGSLADLDRIAEAERRSGARCAGVAQWRFSTRTQQLKGLIADGAFGRPLLALIETAWFRDADYYAAPWRGRWESELGGPTIGVGIHLTDLAIWLLGEWDEVSAMASTLDRDIAVEDVSVANLRFAGGALASIVNSVLSPRQESRLRLDFQHVTVEFHGLYSDNPDNWRLTAKPGSEDRLAAWRRGVAGEPSRMANQFDRFAEAVRGAGEVDTPLAQARPVIDLVSSIYKSAATARSIRRGAIRQGDPFYDRVWGDLPAGAFKPRSV